MTRQIASLDGYDKDRNEFVEIKTPYSNAKDHEMALDGKIPDKYVPQLAHQFLMTNADNAWYFSYFQGSEALVSVSKQTFNTEYMEKLVEEEKKFYECMQNFIAPDITENEYEKFKPEHEETIKKWLEYKTLLDDITAKELIYRKNIQNLCGDKSSTGYGIKITHSIRRGAIDYSKIPQIKDVNLEAYRKPSFESWRITQE